MRPPDFETPTALLDNFLTPLDAFYVRCHMPVPAALDEASWRLAIDGEAGTPASLSLAELRQMPAATVTVTLECAGNGRAFFDPPVAGIQWGKGAVGTCTWTGVRLADLLKRVGARPAATHVWVSGADRPMGTQPPFVRQVPMAKAIDPGTIVAYAMNGQPIPAPHGAPLRLVVPGWEGAYAIKWLNKITLATTEHDGFWVATAYRYPTKRVAPGAAVDPKDMAPLTGLVVKSLITRPLDGAVVHAGQGHRRRLRLGRRDRHRPRRRLDRRRRHLAAGPAHRQGREIRLAALRVHLPRHPAGHAHHAVARHRRPRQHPADGAAVESVGLPVERPGSSAHRGEGVSRSLAAAAALVDARHRRRRRRPSPRSPPLPEGSGAAVARAPCLGCHEADLIVSQRLSPTGWDREVAKMERWGAKVPADARPVLIELPRPALRRAAGGVARPGGRGRRRSRSMRGPAAAATRTTWPNSSDCRRRPGAAPWTRWCGGAPRCGRCRQAGAGRLPRLALGTSLTLG